MSARAAFREADVARALRAAAKAGQRVRIEISLDARTLSIVPLASAELAAPEYDPYLHGVAGGARRAKGRRRAAA